eukprot:6888390-Pyramimonas_sp.AAC.1
MGSVGWRSDHDGAESVEPPKWPWKTTNTAKPDVEKVLTDLDGLIAKGGAQSMNVSRVLDQHFDDPASGGQTAATHRGAFPSLE